MFLKIKLLIKEFSIIGFAIIAFVVISTLSLIVAIPIKAFDPPYADSVKMVRLSGGALVVVSFMLFAIRLRQQGSEDKGENLFLVLLGFPFITGICYIMLF